MPQMPQLPLNPNVRHGVLPNGLNYYLLHNEKPKERANFYIAQKVGSTLETQEQLGLAHFLEHMAFNGTKNYPGKNMLNYLQSKGIRFGADINAYTDFDETVYNIDNIPTTDTQLMDSVLLALRDWSCDILLEEDEINAERGVIEEEWRSRNDANSRWLEAVLPIIYKEYQYQQTPIGKMEVVKNFKPEVLRDYYHKWYRPDQQGIIIVGDFDVDVMEKKVVDLFSPIPMPENAAERVYPDVSHNEAPIYAYFEDPELQFGSVRVSFKLDKLPFELRNTEVGMQADLLKSIVTQLLDNRLTEYAQKPECKYAQAGVYFSKFYVSKTLDSFNIVVIMKNDMMEAFNDAMAVVARACKTGFTDSELSRVRDELLARSEKAYNERNNTENSSLAKELIRTFIDNEPNMGIEREHEWNQQILGMIPVQIVNQLAASLLRPTDQVFLVSMPKTENGQVIAEDMIVGAFNAAVGADYEAYVDEVVSDPLIANLPAPGSIKSVTENKAFGTSEIILSNGVKVIVKPTDFKADEILFSAFADGGKKSYEKSQGADVLMMDDAVAFSKLGQFDNNTLRKYLAGKRANVSFSVQNTINQFNGNSTVKDLPTLMELIYAYFTEVNPDDQNYSNEIDKAISVLATHQKNPMKIYSDTLQATVYGNNPLMASATVEILEAADYSKMLEMYKKAVANAADYTFVFAGNVDVETLKPLLEQYVATLPSTGKKSAVKEVSSIDMVNGQVVNEYKQPMLTPSVMVTDFYSGDNVPFNTENQVLMNSLGQVLFNVFIDTLREEEGGTYTPFATAGLNPNTGKWQIVYQFQTNSDMKDKLVARADAELLKLLADGASAEAFNKVKEANIKQYENQIRTNNYWLDGIINVERGHDTLTGKEAALKNVTLEQLNTFMKNLYNGKNRIQVIMNGVAAE